MASLRFFSNKQIADHNRAAKELSIIKDKVAVFIHENSEKLFEVDVLKFVKKAYKRHGLVNDHEKEFAICAFGINTKEVHYFPKNNGARLKPNTLILLDIWARLDKKNAPYADMTWMFYFGRPIPKGIEDKWKILVSARDAAIKQIKKCLKCNELPRGLDIDRAAHDVIGNAGFGNTIKHTIGHSLGFNSPHGTLPGINWREYGKSSKNVGYTIEPGMYFKNFGMRTEIDFYISKENKIVITTPTQDSIDIV